MATFARFEEMTAWRKARELVQVIYETTSNGRFARDFALRDQLRRSAVSIMANIGEGFERGGNKEFVQFLAMAKGSVGEVRSHLYVALDQRYVDQSTFEKLYQVTREVASLIGGLMNYLKHSRLKGSKFAQPTLNVELETLNKSE